ncbi:MAG: hypothetical protein C0446_14225 [Chitinophaga sp.]|nr:hypothetical protein [Chitinophaga sp.]
MVEHKITDLLHFLKIIENLDFENYVRRDILIFRGQSKKGNLLPNIARDKKEVETKTLEVHLLDQLRLIGAKFLAKENSYLELMVLGQHYGLKTRLLDWTSNPLIALWFACNDNVENDTYVYILETTGLMDKEIYTKCPFSNNTTIVIQPKLNNDRILAQQGFFTLHFYSEQHNRIIALEEDGSIKDRLIEICIPNSSREEIIDSLNRIGVSSRTIFPDLQGLCHHLNYVNKL